MAEDNKPNNLLAFLQELKKSGVSEDRYHEAINEFLGFQARDKRIPLSGQFELTPLCNLDCKMCYVHLKESELKKHGSLLSTEQWKDIMQEAYDAGMRGAVLTGGECLIYPGFKELFLFLKSKEVAISVLTNGVLLDRFIPFFTEHPLKSIRVTLYGSSDDAYEKVTGKREYARVMRNILLAKEAGLPISVAVTPNRFMENDGEKLIATLEEAGVFYSINSLLVSPREETGREKEDMSIEGYLKLYTIWNKYRDIKPHDVDITKIPKEGVPGIPTKGIKCGAGRSNFSVDWCGRLLACTNLTESAVPISKGGFRQAWESVCRFSDCFDNPVECEQCPYKSVCLLCPAMHFDKNNPGHCNPQVCQKTKMLVENGFVEIPCEM